MIRGGTYEIEIQVKDTDTGNPIDLTSATGILVGLYGEGRRLFGKWSYVDKSALGFGDVTITNAVNGILSVALQSEDSLNAIEKICKLEVMVTFNNPMFTDNVQISIDTDIIIEKVERSIFEGVSAL